MPSRIIAGSVFFLVVLAAFSEIVYINGRWVAVIAAAGAITALVFAVLRQSRGRRALMAGHDVLTAGEEEDEHPAGHGGRTRRRLSDAEKEEIIQALFDKIYVEIGRSVVKKILLIAVAFAFAIAAWLGKNHIDFK